MRRSSTRFPRISLLVLTVLVVSGCQGGDMESTPTTASVPTPVAATDDANATTDVLSTADVPAETTGDDAVQTTAAPVAAPTSKDAPITAEDEVEETEDDEPDAGGVVIVQEGTVFTTPAQAAYCSLSAPADGMPAVINCEVSQTSVPPDAELMGYCSSEGYGWYFNFFEDTGHAGFSCNHHDGIVHLPGLDLADDPWVDQSQVHVLPGGTRVPILDYGRVLQAGGLSCSVQPDGLTCSSHQTGRGFTVNSASFVSW